MAESTRYILLDLDTWEKIKASDEEFGFLIKINDIQYCVEKTQIENNGIFYSIQSQNWLDYDVLESFSILKCWIRSETIAPGPDGTPLTGTGHTSQGKKGPFIVPTSWLA